MTLILVVILFITLLIATKILYQTRKNSLKIKKVENKLKTYISDLKSKKA